MSIVGQSNSFMFLTLSQHVFFRHARVPIKQKSQTQYVMTSPHILSFTDAICPFHIFE